MKLLLIIALSICSITAMAQKKVTCKKGSIKADGVEVASFDGGGSLFKPFYLYVLKPGTQDTLIKLQEEILEATTPLLETVVTYRVQCSDSKQRSFSFKNPNSPIRIKDKDIIKLLFNDTVPLLVTDKGLSEEAITTFIARYTYNMDSARQYHKELLDSVATVNPYITQRDRKLPIALRLLEDNSSINQLYPQYNKANKLIGLYQGDVFIGVLEKVVQGGSFAKATYQFWKAVPVLQVRGRQIKFVPLASAATEPGITSSTSLSDVEVKLFTTPRTLKIKAGEYNNMDYPILKLLIDAGLI
jgi:hypothetical protein